MIDLRYGDCLELMTAIPPNSINAIVADLPFGITHCHWDSEIPLDKLWTEYLRIITEDAPIILFASQPFTSNLIMSNIKLFRYCWYWEKERGTGFLNAKTQPLRVIEEICVFYRKPKYNPQMRHIKKRIDPLPTIQSQILNPINSCKEKEEVNPQYIERNQGYPKNILKFNRDKQLIPTQKPLALLEYIVKTYSNKGDLILDNVMGSGTTGLACINLNRNFIGIEKDPTHFEIAKNRLKKAPPTF